MENNENAEEIEFTDVVKVKAPKRVLHFSDGILEEFSEDETDCPPPQQIDVVNPKTLPWISWLSYKAWSAGSTVLAVCDYLGEGLASILGITSPKYWYEIEEYKRREAERLEKMKMAEGWSEPSSTVGGNQGVITTDQPSSFV